MLLMYTHMHDPAMAWWYWYATASCRIYIIQLHSTRWWSDAYLQSS